MQVMAKNGEVNPSCRPMARESAVTVELCELGLPPRRYLMKIPAARLQ